MKSGLKKAVSLILIFVIAHGIPMLARVIAQLIDYSFILNDPMCQLLYMFVTYTLQVALAILAIKLLVTRRLPDAGFNLQNKAESMKVFLRFMLVWTGILVVFYAVALTLMPSFLDYLRSFCPPDALYGVKNVVGGSMLAGLGEEPLFRGLVLLFLAKHWQGDIRIGKLRLTHASLITGFIFMTAHIGYVFVPRFEIIHFDALQLCYTFVLGITWSHMLEKTGSLLAPVLSHIWANFIQYALAYVTVFVLF